MRKKNSPPAYVLIVIWITIILLMLVSSPDDKPKSETPPLSQPLAEFLSVTYGVDEQDGCKVVWEQKPIGPGIPKYFYLVTCEQTWNAPRLVECHNTSGVFACYQPRAVIR